MNIPLNIDFQQVLLHVMNFVILAAGLSFLVFKPVKKFMAKREQYFADRENAAAEKEKHAARIEEEYKNRIAEADAEIRKNREEEAARLSREAQLQIDETKKKTERIIEEAKKDAEAQREKILKSAQQEIVDMVVDATGRLIAKSKDPETEKALYDQFISDAGKDNAENDK